MTREEARAGWIRQQFDVNLPDGRPMLMIMDAPLGTTVCCTRKGKITINWPYPPPEEAEPIQVEIVPNYKELPRTKAAWMPPPSRYAAPPPARVGTEGEKLIDEWVKLRVTELQNFYAQRNRTNWNVFCVHTQALWEEFRRVIAAARAFVA